MKRTSKRHKSIARALGSAIHRYAMIEDGDRIAVGLSGGKDSLTLMHMLTALRRKAPVNFELFPIYVDPGFEGGFSDRLSAYCEENGWNAIIEHTDHGTAAHAESNKKNPCFICARKRRTRLFELADELACRKLALGHNRDDIIETLFLNIFYSGQISTMRPSQSLFKGKFTIIRPLAFVDEEAISAFVTESGFPAFVNTCPTSKVSKRKEVKEWLEKIYAGDRNIKGNVFRALSHVKEDYLLN